MHAYKRCTAKADKGSDQGADGNADRSNLLHQPDTQNDIDCKPRRPWQRGQILFPGGHDRNHIGICKVTKHVAQHQHLKVKSTVRSIGASDP